MLIWIILGVVVVTKHFPDQADVNLIGGIINGARQGDIVRQINWRSRDVSNSSTSHCLRLIPFCSPLSSPPGI